MITLRHLLLTSGATIGYASEPELEKRSTDSSVMMKYWEKVEAVLDGIEGMRECADKFLPMFRDEDALDYKFRQQCTTMSNVYRDIVEGLSSKPFEQMVQLINDQTDGLIPEQINQFVWDVDGSGNNLTVFAAHTFFNGVNHAIDWIMVDHAPHDPSVRSLADARERGLRPYWSHVLGRNILDVQSTIVGSKELLTYVKIMEPGEPDHIREFERLSDGSVVWRLWRKATGATVAGQTDYTQIDGGEVSIKVIPLVPFVTGRRDGRRWRFDPPMRAAVELQIEMFQQESGLKHATTLTAYPMLAANGIKPPVGADGKPVTKITVGPSRVLWSPPRDDGGPAGNWAYVEPGSESLKFLEQRISNTEQRLRELGRQPLTASSSNITVITAAVAAGKAKSAVKAWAYTLKDALENALLLTARWMNVEYNPTVHVFAEFDDWMEGEDLTALDGARTRGDISHETYCEELQRRGVLSSNFTIERERIRLLTEVPGDGIDTEPME